MIFASICFIVIAVGDGFLSKDDLDSQFSNEERIALRDQASAMFSHAFNAYMKHAYPADELMPLSCKGRVRGKSPSRGDLDDAMGDYALTLLDSMDTLVVLGNISAFESAVRLVLADVKFDADVVVSVFETNIRILGGLLSSHVLATHLKEMKSQMLWYNDELLGMAKDIADRLLPAFNTPTGIPRGRINLKRGLVMDIPNINTTCTACAGTFLLEFAALSRLTGDSRYEKSARRAMDALWSARSRESALPGTVIDLTSLTWISKEAGVGAGSDSYYEYLLKSYVLLGDSSLLDRFNKHYVSLKKYLGLNLQSVLMHRPWQAGKSYIDALGAFWPGLQVLAGDLGPAIETHTTLESIARLHRHLLPEAVVASDPARVYWPLHAMRPEIIESTLWLWRATKDPHYRRLGRSIMTAIEQYSRVSCGFAALADVSSLKLDDRMDSFVLAETFKYLFLLFADDDELVFKLDDYVLTTEGHFLPLRLQNKFIHKNFVKQKFPSTRHKRDFSSDNCPMYDFLRNPSLASTLRKRIMDKDKTDKQGCQSKPAKREFPTPSNFLDISPIEFQRNNPSHLLSLEMMGITVGPIQNQNVVQITQHDGMALNSELALKGRQFILSMIEHNQETKKEGIAFLQIISPPYFGAMHFEVGVASFGPSLGFLKPIEGQIAIADPFDACSFRSKSSSNPSIEDDNDSHAMFNGRIVLVQRGGCLFIQKVRLYSSLGAIAVIVIDNVKGSSISTDAPLLMAGDDNEEPPIPSVFALEKEGISLLNLYQSSPNLRLTLSKKFVPIETIISGYKISNPNFSMSIEDVPNYTINDLHNSFYTNLDIMSTIANFARQKILDSAPSTADAAVEGQAEYVFYETIENLGTKITTKYKDKRQDHIMIVADHNNVEDMFSSGLLETFRKLGSDRIRIQKFKSGAVCVTDSNSDPFTYQQQDHLYKENFDSLELTYYLSIDEMFTNHKQP